MFLLSMALRQSLRKSCSARNAGKCKNTLRIYRNTVENKKRSPRWTKSYEKLMNDVNREGHIAQERAVKTV